MPPLEPLAPVRKKPRQGRAKVTVAAILEAAARILEAEGEEALTTGAVAHLAGCSIGTLYQYFSDRDELLLALVDSERQRILDKVRGLTAELKPSPRPVIIRELVRVLIASFKARRGASRQFELVMVLSTRGRKPALLEIFAELLTKGDRRSENEEEQVAERVRTFVLTRAMLGVLRAAALEDDRMIDDKAFEDALCLLVEAFWIERTNCTPPSASRE